MQPSSHISSMAESAPRKKRGYHHGDLRAALIDAAETLIREGGALDFTVADASRMAGVSTAAPYRHFADKEELLDAVRARGFDRLTRAMRERIDALGAPGTIDEIAAIGRAYVRFARDEPDVFRLMFASRHERRPGAASGVAGATCFGTLLERVALLRRATEDAVDAELTTVALPLWSLVHGVATLEIDGGFAAVAPATSPEQVVDFATRHYLDGLVNGCGQSSA